MKLSIQTESYNEKRYGKPYIGVLDAESGSVSRWGNWIGTPGSAGMLEVEAAVGDAVIKGQKDNRGNNGDPAYGIVRVDGSIERMSKVEAIQAARAPSSAEPTLADILAALGVATTTEALAKIQSITN